MDGEEEKIRNMCTSKTAFASEKEAAILVYEAKRKNAFFVFA